MHNYWDIDMHRLLIDERRTQLVRDAEPGPAPTFSSVRTRAKRRMIARVGLAVAPPRTGAHA